MEGTAIPNPTYPPNLTYPLVLIRKSSGELVEFSLEKLRDSIMRAGADGVAALRVANDVMRHVTDGMTTKQLHDIVNRELARSNMCVACRYSLREGLAKLGPSGFHFEVYVAALLRANGYETNLPEEYMGDCVRHEVDVEALKGGRRSAIEVKFRNNSADHVKLTAILIAHARFNDLVAGAKAGKCPKFDEAWVVTNGLFSDRAQTYAGAHGMKLVGWGYPKGQGLERLIDSSGLYPVTVLVGLSDVELASLAKAGLMLCKDIAGIEPEDLAGKTGIDRERCELLVRLAGEIVEPAQTHAS